MSRIFSTVSVNLITLYSIFQFVFAIEGFKDSGHYRKVVLDAMTSIENNLNILDEVKTNNVINSIYNAAKIVNASKEELIVFTSIALTNMYNFQIFTYPDSSENEKSIDSSSSRGLLQVTSKEFYIKLNQITPDERDYINYPYKLNEFTSESILDEFILFKDCFYPDHKKCDLNNIEKIHEYVIISMGSGESMLLKPQARNITRTPKIMDLEERLKRRRKILNCLLNSYKNKKNI